ncbi:MAG: heme NO-binding protein [Alphaproteobacteria bacterium]|nr:heme NO-binding protein [Alphaproteobacteria bacterium]
MHGLVNRSIQCFIRDTYGVEIWEEICREADLGFNNFESLLMYDVSLTDAVLSVAGKLIGRCREGLLEDMGTYLVSNPDLDALRRLLRFGGENFEEFLHSLDDLHDRVKLALPDLDIPVLELKERTAHTYSLSYRWKNRGFGALVLGILRAMADDYGALVLLEHSTMRDGLGELDQISISLLDGAFAQGRGFDLGAQV